MPRLRQRMTCRRGGTRGRSVGDRPSPSRQFSESPSGSALGRPPASPPHETPHHFATSAPQPSGSHFIRQTTQRAELRFDSAFNRPSITAYITITLREDATLRSPPWPDSTPASLDPHPASVEPRSTSAATPQDDMGEPSVNATPSLGLFSMQVNADAVQGTGAHHVEADAEDPGDDFGCPIEEEQSSPVNSN